MAAAAFDPARPYRCSPSVALRPEPFGALAYHFGTRRLTFLKTPVLVRVVQGLERHADVHAALDGAGVPDRQRPAYLHALAGLSEAGTIEPRLGDRIPGGEPECRSSTASD
jgi:putative mycofactocin binding protein MftB